MDWAILFRKCLILDYRLHYKTETMKLIRNIILGFIILFSVPSCSDYLDVVPDDIATIDDAFSSRVNARKYLFTCYHYLPEAANLWNNPAHLASDEFFVSATAYGYHFKGTAFDITLNLQSANKPILNFHEGREKGYALYKAIRSCNTFIANIHTVPDMDDYEKNTWKGESLVLKAFYHFYLLRMYGPIPLLDEEIPVSIKPEEIDQKRVPVSDCFRFILDLMDEAIELLPVNLENPLDEKGRITQVIAKAIKARVLLEQASPLFNGNSDYATYTNGEGVRYFPEYDAELWKKAADAFLDAIESAEVNGHKLHITDEMATGTLDEIVLRKTLRERVTERWNDEIVWGDSKGSGQTNNIQRYSQANFYKDGQPITEQSLAVTMGFTNNYYTENGIPISEDVSWQGIDKMVMQTSEELDKYKIKKGKSIPAFHFGREPRFYSDLGFDRGTWLWQGRKNVDDPYVVYARNGETSGKQTISQFSVTGYFPKKVVNINNSFNGKSYTIRKYAFPFFRLSEMYLGYAEAMNEYTGPSTDVYDYIDRVRNRAGLLGVVQSWKDYSSIPDKPLSQAGLREIIQRERTIELAFEGKRYWDLRRWKRARVELSKKVEGWNVFTKDKEDYYNVVELYHREFQSRDYFWPMRSWILTVNSKLDQTHGW